MEKHIGIYNAFGKDKPEEVQPQYHMNCAEVLLRAANDEYDLQNELGIPQGKEIGFSRVFRPDAAPCQCRNICIGA